MFTTYAIIYLIIGCAFAVYLPISHADAQHKLQHHVSQQQWDTLSPREKQLIMITHGPSSPKYTVGMMVIVGLLWPLQLVVVVVAEVWRYRYRRRQR